MDFDLKPSEPEDEAFLRQLNKLAYEEVVVAQFGSWDPVKQEAFFDAKWRTQTYSIIVANGVPVGAVSSARSDAELTLFELLVVSEYQNVGIGHAQTNRLGRDLDR